MEEHILNPVVSNQEFINNATNNVIANVSNEPAQEEATKKSKTDAK